MRMRVIGILAVLGLAAIALPAPRIWADTDTVQAKTSSPLPALIDRALPSNLSPSLANAKSDRPKPYADRCHTQQDLSKSESNCEYGYLKSKTTIVLFGDSHALSWFPAIEKLAIAKKWKLLSLTMSSCWPSDIPAWNSTTNKLMDNCELWRMETLSDIVALKPAMIFVSGTRGFSTVDTKNRVLLGDARTATWEKGMISTLETLKKASKRVVYLGDTPISDYDVPVCLKAHFTSIAACATPFAKAVSMAWRSEEHHVADTENVFWVDPTSWICTTDPCSPLVGRYQIFVDKGHLTATFAGTLERPLWAQISGIRT